MTKKSHIINVAHLAEVPLKNHAVVRIPEGKKRNPNSLRFLIAHIVQLFFDSNRSVAAENMASQGGVYLSERSDRPKKTINYDALSEILRDEKHIAYWQLEAISQTVKIPVGALLLFSRLYSHMQIPDDTASKELIKSIYEFNKCLMEVQERGDFSRDDFEKFAACFDYLYKLEQRPFKF